jgi:uncharacterized membrane protein
VNAIYALLFLALPAAVIWLTHHQRWAERVGVIVLCYLGGLLLGNSGLLPAGALPVQQGITEAAIALALPMLLFTLDVRQWRGVAGRALLSMLFATTSVVTLATLLFFLYREEGTQTASHLAAMSVGVYTGGTPNLAAIKAGLDIPHSEYILFHTLDTVVGAFYLMAMLTVGIPLFRRLLSPPEATQSIPDGEGSHFDEDDFRPLLDRKNLPQLLRTLALSGAVLVLSLGLSRLAEETFSLENSSALLIVLLTTFGIVLSLVPGVRRMYLAYRAGMYLIYVFCFAVASMAGLGELVRVDMSVAVFIAGTIVGSLTLHTLLCKLARIDSDTFMVTSVAAVCSPPFVPMLARALNNPGTILSGMTTGIIGYALGNYLGISLALVLQRL